MDTPWLTRERLTVYSWMIVAGYLVTAVIFHVMARDQAAQGQAPMIVDFNAFYAVSMLLEERRGADAYDTSRLHEVEKRSALLAFPGGLKPDQVESVPAMTWMYPPTFFLALPPLAKLPYMAAYLLWVGATLALFVAAARRMIPDPAVVPVALAYPTTIVTTMFGQTGFLTAGLLGLGLALLGRRPVLAGVLIGLISFKPQFGVLIPFALVAGGHWRAFAAAAATVVGAALLSAVAFGTEPWAAFMGGAGHTQAVLEKGGGAWTTMVTAFAAVRLPGGSLPIAWGVQAIFAAGAVGAVVWTWRQSQAPDALKAAVLCLCVYLATPFAYVYDLPILALGLVALGWDMHQRGWRPWEGGLVVAGWLLPIAAPAATTTLAFNPAPLVIAALTVVALRRVAARA